MKEPSSTTGMVALPETIEEVHPREIARATELDPSDVRRVLEKLHQLEHERKPWRNPDLLHEMYYSEGLTQEQIADRLGCSASHVSREMKRHEIEPGRGRLTDTARQLMATNE